MAWHQQGLGNCVRAGQGWRDDLPALFQRNPSMQSFMWQGNMVLLLKLLRVL